MTHGKKRETEDAACRDLNAIKKKPKDLSSFLWLLDHVVIWRHRQAEVIFSPLYFSSIIMCVEFIFFIWVTSCTKCNICSNVEVRWPGRPSNPPHLKDGLDFFYVHGFAHRALVPSTPRQRKVAETVWPVPDAVIIVICSPDDGWSYHLKHVERAVYRNIINWI